MKIIYTFLLSCCMVFHAQAQFQKTLYQFASEDLVATHSMNPAFKAKGSFILGLPGISQNTLNFSAPTTLGNLFMLENGKRNLSLGTAVKNLPQVSTTYASSQLNILSLGGGDEKNMFMMSLDIRGFTKQKMSRDFLDLAINGNSSSISIQDVLEGKRLTDQEKYLYAETYSHFFGQLSLSDSRKLSDRVRLGLRVKFLWGMGYMSSSPIEGTYRMDGQSFNSSIDFEAANVNMSGVVDPLIFLEEQKMENKKMQGNFGGAIDIGTQVKITDRWEASFFVQDIGAINWNLNGQSVKIEKGYYEINAQEISLTGGIDGDSQLADFDLQTFMEEEVKMDTLQNQKFVEWLPAKAYLGTRYRVGEKHYFGATFMGQWFQNEFNYAMTASYDLRLGKMLSTIVSYSYSPQQTMAVGGGVRLNLGPLQVYAVTDDFTGLIKPSTLQNVNITTGAVFTFGRKHKAKVEAETTAE